MDVHTIPALDDNYMYLIVDRNVQKAAVVDPVEPDKVLDKLKELNVDLQFVFTTHHHWDHSGGNKKLLDQLAGHPLKVFGGDDRVPGLTNQVKQGDEFAFGNTKVKCLHTPCHTTGHICYFLEDDQGQRVVFTGDTLFVAGCGRFFEGTAEQMLAAMDQLAQLPDETKVYCGHEYTQTNLLFAQTVDPTNKTIEDKLIWTKSQRNAKQPTVPSTIFEEKQTNPFMRVRQPTIQTQIGFHDAVQVMQKLRSLKDNFKPK